MKVDLTRRQVEVLLDAACYWETVLDDKSEEPDSRASAERDIATLGRAMAALFRSMRSRRG